MKQKMLDQIEAEAMLFDISLDYLDITDEAFNEMLTNEHWVAEQTCTCGTYITHKEIDPEYHSSWCKIKENL